MKKAILCLMLLLIFSCTQETENQEDLNLETVSFSNMKLNLDLQISNQLFDFKDSKDLKDKLNDFTNDLSTESLDLIDDMEKVKNVVTLISIKEGVVYLDGYAYLDENNKVLQSFYSETRNSDPLEEMLDGAPCPEGYETLGRCNNFVNTQTCVSQHVTDYLTESLNGIGDCANVQINIGVLNTSICGRTC